MNWTDTKTGKRYYLPWVSILAAGLTLFGGCLTGGFTGTDRAADENVKSSGRSDRGQGLGDFRVDRRGGPGSPVGGGGPVVWDYDLDYSSVVVSPDGKFLIGNAPVPGPNEGWAAPGLVLVVQELPSGDQGVYEELFNVQRINFSPDGKRAYLLENGGMSIAILNLETMDVLPERRYLTDKYTALDVGPYGRFLIATNLPTNDFEEAAAGWSTECTNIQSRCWIDIVDLTGTASGRVDLGLPVRDLDWSPVRYEMVLTLVAGATNTPNAKIAFVNPENHAIDGMVTVPNCADELKIQPNGTLGLLSPVACSQNGFNAGFVLNRGRFVDECPDPQPVQPQSGNFDPISVIDLDKRQFVENLPGFGPVVVTPDGQTAIGFTRRDDMVQQWGYNQIARTGLIKVDLDTLDWTVTEFGELEPSYVLSPDGQTLYTYTDGQVCTRQCAENGGTFTTCEEAPANLTRWSVKDMAFTTIQGGDVLHLREMAFGQDQTLYAVENGQLYALGTDDTWVGKITTSLFAPELLNITDTHLVLGTRHLTSFRLVALDDGAQHTVTLMP